MKASEIARLLDAVLEGGADPEITGAAPLERAGAGDLSIVARERYLPYVESSHAGLLLVATDLEDRTSGDRPRIVLGDVHAALTVVLPELYPEAPVRPGVHPTAVVEDGADVADDAAIGPHVVVGARSRVGARAAIGAQAVLGPECEIGPDVVLHPHVTLYRGTVVGAHSEIHSGTRLGVDGFGYAEVDGVPRKVPQVGRCIIGRHVEIGANVTIDRGSIGDTEIGDHVKIDNLVQIGHNVRVAAGSIIVSQVGVSGSTKIGRGVTLGGQAGIAGHIEIGEGARIAGQAGVFGDVPPGETWSGYPARPHRTALRAQAAIFRLPDLLKRLRALEERLEKRDSEE